MCVVVQQPVVIGSLPVTNVGGLTVTVLGRCVLCILCTHRERVSVHGWFVGARRVCHGL